MTSPVPENQEKETRPHPPKDYIPPIIVCKDCKRVGYSVAHFMDPSQCKCGSTNILESRSEAGAKYIKKNVKPQKEFQTESKLKHYLSYVGTFIAFWCMVVGLLRIVFKVI